LLDIPRHPLEVIQTMGILKTQEDTQIMGHNHSSLDILEAILEEPGLPRDTMRIPMALLCRSPHGRIIQSNLIR
jgi:hypothetical protein